MVEMKLIGDVGVVEDSTISLFQCPRCKTVGLQKWIDGSTLKCPNCIGAK